MDPLAPTEAALLANLPFGSRIVSPSARTFIKHSDGQWWNWSNNTCTGLTLQRGHVISPGSKVYYPNEGRERYVKHNDGRWLSIQSPSGAVASSMAAGNSAGHPSATPSANVQIIIIPQAVYHNGPVPADGDAVVTFNVPLSSAAKGDVPYGTQQAFTGGLTAKEKVSIRFEFPYTQASGFKAKQHNLRRGPHPITRGQLAQLVAEEVRRVLTAHAGINVAIATRSDGRPVAFEELILVDVRRVSDGSLQPTIARRVA